MICYSRLDFTTHYSCRVSSAEFPWVIQVLCWCKGEQKLVLFFCIVSIWFHLFKHLVYVFAWTVSPSSLPFGGGCHFQWKLSIKGKGQTLPFTPCATRIKGTQRPQNTNVLITMGLETILVNTCARSSACSKHKHTERSPCYVSVVLQALFGLQVSSRVCTLTAEFQAVSNLCWLCIINGVLLNSSQNVVGGQSCECLQVAYNSVCVCVNVPNWILNSGRSLVQADCKFW